MPGSSSKHSKHGKGSKEPKEPKKSKPLVVTGDKCGSCGRLKTDPPVEGTYEPMYCEDCNGTGLSVTTPYCYECAGHGVVSVKIGGCKTIEQHYCTRPMY